MDYCTDVLHGKGTGADTAFCFRCINHLSVTDVYCNVTGVINYYITDLNCTYRYRVICAINSKSYFFDVKRNG